MAKPGSVTPWATNANYAGGPFIGTPTKVAVPAGVIADGWQPDQKPPSEYQNQWQSDVAAWVSWVNEGVATPDESAHLVETDGSGRITAAFATLGPLVGDNTVLTIVPLAGGSAIGIDVHGTGIRAGIVTTGGDTAGAGVDAVQSNAGNNDPAVLGRRVGSTGDGVEGRGNTAGRGVYGEADQSSGTGHGVEGLGGDSGGAGCLGTAQTAGAAGVQGTNTNTNGAGVKGTTVAAASSSAFAVQGLTGTGDATAVQGRASDGDGHGGFFFSKIASPVRSALRLVPQDTDPTSGAPGDVYVNDGVADERVIGKLRGTAIWEAMLTNVKGFAWASDFTTTAANNNNVAYTVGATAVIAAAGASAPNETGEVFVLAFASFRNTAGSLQGVDVRIRDSTAGADVLAAEVLEVMPTGTGNTEHTWAKFVSYTLPSVGVSRNIEIEFRKTAGAGTGVSADNLGLLILGVF